MRIFAMAAIILCWTTSARCTDGFLGPVETTSDVYARLAERPVLPASPTALPDGTVAVSHDGGDIATAWYEGPTSRYRHGILGDTIEASRLVVELRNGRRKHLDLADAFVFEDRYPRLADLDSDGKIEIVTIRSSVDEGASVTVYGLDHDDLVQLATTGFIGRPNRWLNIAGIDDYAGSGHLQIAFVRTPHIGGTLNLIAFREGELIRLAETDGFSNHVIGSRDMELSATADFNADGKLELALPNASRDALRIVELTDDRLVDRASIKLPGRIDKNILVGMANGRPVIHIGLDNGRFYTIQSDR